MAVANDYNQDGSTSTAATSPQKSWYDKNDWGGLAGSVNWTDLAKPAGNLWMSDKLGGDVSKLQDAYKQASSAEDLRLARLQSRDAIFDRLNLGAIDGATSSVSKVMGAGDKMEQFLVPLMQQRDLALARTGQLDQKQMDALGNLDLVGKLYAAQDEQDKNRILNTQGQLSNAISALFQGTGGPSMVSQAKINADAEDIFKSYQADLDRTMSMVNSQGRADSIRNGMDLSTMESDRQDDVVRKFAPMFMDARNKAMDAAIQRNAGTSQAINQSRAAALQDVTGQYATALNTAGSLYRPRDAEMKTSSAMADAFTKLFSNERNYSSEQMKNAIDVLKGSADLASKGASLSGNLMKYSDDRDLDLYKIMADNRAEILKNLASASQEQAKYVQTALGQGQSALSGTGSILAPILSEAGKSIASNIGEAVTNWGTDIWNWATDGFDLTFG